MRHGSPASDVAPVRFPAALSLSRQLAALMRFHVIAYRESDLGVLLQEACQSVVEGVGAGFAGVLQYRADEQAFVLQAGVGTPTRFVGRARSVANLGTTAGLAWHTDQLVHFRHLPAGNHVRVSEVATGQGIRRMVSVPVHGEGEEAFGVLEVGSAEAGEFAQSDLTFLQALADCIGAAVARHADRTRRADRAALVAERRVDHGCGERVGRFSAQNAAKRRQASTFSGLQQDDQIPEGNG